MALRALGNPIAGFIDYLSRTGTDASTPYVNNQGLTATGGVISDYVDGSDIYRAHIFTSSGTFNVSAIGDFPADVEYLVVAGGGGGGVDNFGAPRFGSGGGAGGLRTNLPGVVDAASSPLTGSPFPVSTSPGSYTVTIGGGGSGGVAVTYQVAGLQGSPSSFDTITSTGGGGGAGHNPGPTGPTPAPATTGGSGGGGQPGTREGNTPPTSPPQGNDGGVSDAFSGSGGGGAGARGFNAPSTGTGNPGPSEPGAGGIGVRFTQIPASIGTPGPNPGIYFAGGGGGAPQGAAGGSGGGGAGNGTSGTYSTGGGGGARFQAAAGAGGSGIVVVRYQIGTIQTGTAKATGGAISYYGGKTIHTFTSSGTFATAPNWTATNVEYVVVGGGGGGATNYGGGGGAGGYRTGTTPIGAHPISTTIQIGAGGLQSSGSVLTANGTPSYFGAPITAAGGGTGGPDSIGGPGSGLDAGAAGGSGGGHGLDGPGTVAAGNTPPTSPPQGNPGGTGSRSTNFGGGGGGGAGGAGQASTSGAAGGIGIQIPSTFLNPASVIGTPGPNPGAGYVAGGGRGGINNSTGASRGIGGGGYQNSPAAGGTTEPGLENMGAGGGGQYQGTRAGNGGSGIVLIAYPS
jgi:hypothetical protein